MVKVLLSFAAVLALLVGVAPADAAPKPTTLFNDSYVDVPLVDDDGVTRLFAVTAKVVSYPDGTVQVTCSYSVRGRDVTNREAYPYVGIYEIERLYQLRGPVGDPGLPTAPYTRQSMLDFCVDQFDNPTQRRDPDPTPPS